MAECDLRFDMNASSFDETLKKKITELAIKDGWGVFESRIGISAYPGRGLLGVWQEREEADGIAEHLNETEGELEYQVHDDEESGVYRHIYFQVGHVVLRDIEPEVILRATYDLVPEE